MRNRGFTESRVRGRLRKKTLDIHIQYMYVLHMALALRKKPVTVYLQELKYLMFQQMARAQNRKAAELVREAMDEYIQNHGRAKKPLDSWQPISLGGLKANTQDWISKDYQDEMLGSAF